MCFSPLSKAEDKQFLLPETFVKRYNKNRVGSEEQYGPRLVGEILHDFLKNSQEPFARAFRQSHLDAFGDGEAEEEGCGLLFKNIHPNTEPCVDLKLYTRTLGRLDIGEVRPGAITRDGESHFTFIEGDLEKKDATPKRNPHVFDGKYITITRKDDGTLRPNFKSMPVEMTMFSYAIGVFKELLNGLSSLIEEEWVFKTEAFQ